jgi:membrane-bound serine protease (ClpP class)
MSVSGNISRLPRASTMNRGRSGRRIVVAFLCFASMAAVSITLSAAAQSRDPALRSPVIYRARIEGVVNPFSAHYLERAIRETERAGAAALIVELDTPGGLDTAMRSMIKAELNAHVPIIVYVSPSGARAASAGMFIALAAHVVAMAPGTAIGAAHPVSLTGGGEEGDTMMAKVTEDAAAIARAIAAHRARNVTWAESAVRNSVSITETEAKEKGVIDIVARDLPDMLEQVEGLKVTTPAGEVQMHLKGARVQDLPMSFVERLLHLIAEPNIAYILLTIGTLGLIVELYHPGVFFPGVTGAICLLLGFAALGTLPVGWAGAALLVLAVCLLLAELHAPGFGAFGVGSLIAFVLGSLLLFVPVTPPSPASPVVRVSPWLIGTMTALFAGTILLIGQRVWAAQRMRPRTGPEALVGAVGEATSPLSPEGTVRIRGEAWSAISEGDPIEAGSPVRVERTDGVVLVVTSVGSPDDQGPPP